MKSRTYVTCLIPSSTFHHHYHPHHPHHYYGHHLNIRLTSLSLSLNAFFVLHLFLVLFFFNTLNTPFFRVPKPGFHKNFVFQLEYRSLLVDNIHCNTIDCNIFEFEILSLFINTYWYILKNVVTINAIDL